MTRSASRWNTLGELVATGVVLVAATTSGALLFALAATERWQFQDLLLRVGLPAVVLLVLALVLAAGVGWHRLRRGILVGGLSGLIATIGLEAVRITGFRALETMPGDLPMLMGVKATGRIMAGPNTTSTILGYADHFWNGAAFGVIFALLIGGFPRKWGAWSGALLGAVYGLLLGFGFATGPVPTSLGIGGVFATVTVAEFQTTVYLAHLVFGLILGALVHRFGSRIAPLWVPVVDLFRGVPRQGGSGNFSNKPLTE
ncbi:hypothetical protein [Amycolatopsis cihanbeyliensis]|uniref:Uncharacterized protein n=1 Tax=Amycolatopsis cihanbeyliensis TaxID=1128664 RepID=A0A542DF91_AMYCI|nr:hypothetical protein [Amycolatopsis cihanbeyliensis]TQJ01734.1 hypothetical protein FB471_1443 [Amycolatopsis cihanbeyliensis]